MSYVIPLVLVLLLIAGFVTFLVLNATNKSGPAARDESVPGIGDDETPLGDTREHAGAQREDGTTARDPEGGAGRDPDPDAAAHLARPGEAEGHERLEFETPESPASERRS